MILSEYVKEQNELYKERHELTFDRIKKISSEKTVDGIYQPYFQSTASFLVLLEEVRSKIQSGIWDAMDFTEMQKINENLYEDIKEEHYKTSYGNPEYAEKILGAEIGKILSVLYAEMRAGIAYAFENRMDYLTILGELFIEVYNCFEEERTPNAQELRQIIYWYASDYCDVFLADRIEEQVLPEASFATEIIMKADLEDDRSKIRK